MKIRNNLYRILVIIITSSLLQSCNKDDSSYSDNPTSGKIKISVDETFAPIMDTEIATFQQIYRNATVVSTNKSENDAFNDLIADSVRLIVSTRKLNAEENDYFKRVKIEPNITKIAFDAIALIINPANEDSSLDLSSLKNILNGNFQKWNDLNPLSKLKDIQIVFDHPGSSTVRFIKELIGSDSLSSNCYAVKTNKAVIEYVSKNKNAIGVIGSNWISDFDNSNTQKFLSTIRVIGLKSNDPKANPDEYYQPYQAYIAQKFYPLMREVYIISREARAGLGTGFAAFVAGEKGQRIILKSGLLPAIAPVRLVEIKNENVL